MTLAIAFLALSATILLAFGVLQTLSNLAVLQEAVANELQLIAQQASQPVSNFIQDKFSIMKTATNLIDLTKMTSDEREQALGSLLGRDPAFRQIAILNAKDQEITKASRLSQQATSTLTDQLQGEALTQIHQGKPWIGAVHVDSYTSEPLILLATPMLNVFGDFQGILVAEVNLKFMWDLMDQLKVGDTGVAYVIDKQGDLLAFRDITRVLGRENVANLPEVHKYITGVSGTPFLGLITGIQGVPVIGAYEPLGTPDWAVITELPWNEAYHNAIQGVVTSFVLLAIMVTLAGLLGAYVARRLSVPLINLTNTASRISAGELELQAAAGGPREVGALAHAFNDMTARLHNLIDTLEVRVEMRTAQIQASADIGRIAASILDPDQLLAQTVSLIIDRFGFYYAAVFTLDDSGKWAVLREAQGPGDAAQVLKQAQHRLELDGNSMVAAALRHRRPRIALDVGEEAVRFANPLLPDTRSEVALPLIVGDEILGVLDVQSVQPGAFDETSTTTLQAMADQIAVAMNNAYQYRRERARAQQTTSLVEATVELATLAENADSEGRMLDLAMVLLKADEAALWQPVEQTDQVELVRAIGAKLTTGLKRRSSLQQGALGQAYESGYVIRLDADQLQREGWWTAFNATAQAMLIVPLNWRDRIVGLFTVIRDSAKPFSTDDMNTAQLFATQAAAILENARLFNQVQAALEELNAANQRLTSEAWQAYLRGDSIVHEYQDHSTTSVGPAPLTLHIPVELRGEPIGVVTLEDDQPQRELTADERSIVESVIQQMALALEGARLFEQTQSALGEARRLAQREQLVNRIVGQLRGAVSVDEVLRIATAEMRQALRATYATAKLTPTDAHDNGRGHDHDS